MEPQPINRPLRAAWPLLALLGAFLLLTGYFAAQGFLGDLGHRVRGVDGVYYFIYLPSVWLDGDLDFLNNLRVIYGAGFDPPRTVTGLAPSQWSVGPAILWTPFYLIGHLAALGMSDATSALNGLNPPHQTMVYIGSAFYGVLGIGFTFLFLRTWVSEKASLIGTLGILIASPLTYYLWPFTLMAHTPAFAMSALFLWLWRKKGLHPLTALAAALMVLCRWQTVVILLPAAMAGLAELLETGSARERRQWLTRHLLFAALFLAGLFPQAWVWKVLFDQWFLIPHGSDFLVFRNLAWGPVLFSTHHGLFTWHPLLLAGLLGLGLLWRRSPWEMAAFLIVFVLQWMVVASLKPWTAGWSFGHRMFMELLPLFALGLGLLAAWAAEMSRKGLWGAWATLLCFGWWNLQFVYQYQKDLIPRDRPLAFHELVTDKFRLGTVEKAHNKLAEAMASLREEAFPEAHRLAMEAYAIAPDYPKIHLVVALTALIVNDLERGAPIMAAWQAREPEELLPRWALAEAYRRQGAYDKADRLFPLETSEGVAKEIGQLLRQRDKTLLGPLFLNHFKAYQQKIG